MNGVYGIRSHTSRNPHLVRFEGRAENRSVGDSFKQLPNKLSQCLPWSCHHAGLGTYKSNVRSRNLWNIVTGLGLQTTLQHCLFLSERKLIGSQLRTPASFFSNGGPSGEVLTKPWHITTQCIQICSTKDPAGSMVWLYAQAVCLLEI